MFTVNSENLQNALMLAVLMIMCIRPDDILMLLGLSDKLNVEDTLDDLMSRMGGFDYVNDERRLTLHGFMLLVLLCMLALNFLLDHDDMGSMHWLQFD